METLSDGRQVPVGDMGRVLTGKQPELQLVPQVGAVGFVVRLPLQKPSVHSWRAELRYTVPPAPCDPR